MTLPRPVTGATGPIPAEDEASSTEIDLLPKGGKLPSYIKDHRARLRERFMSGGGDTMPDYELLELFLFRAIPRKDVKPLARALIHHFGDFSRVVSASPARLIEVEGVGPAVITEIKVLEAAAKRMARAKVRKTHVIDGWVAVLDYCHTMMAHLETEQFRVLYLDRKNMLIADEAQGSGTIDHVPVYPREVVKRALELNAASLILVHNHPSGDPTPSQQDIEMTQQVARAAQALGITLHDHIVIGQSKERSFRASGLI